VISDAQRAATWLEQHGVRRTADGRWQGPVASGDEALESAADVAHEWTDQIWVDADLTSVQQLDLALGLLDLLDEYWVTAEVRFHVRGQAPMIVERLWEGYRERLERVESAD
jgi:hypothetical protein